MNGTCEFNEAEFVAKCHRVTGRMAIGAIGAVGTAIREAVQHATTKHPYKNRTGNLEASTTGDVESVDAMGASGEVRATMNYASYVDRGTSRSKPYPFMGPAERIAERVINREIRASVPAAQAEIDRG